MKTFFKFLIAVFLISIIGLGIIGYTRFRSPTTAEMAEFFFEHQSMFEQKNVAILSALSQKAEIDSGPNTEVGYRWLETQPAPYAYQDSEPMMVRYYTHLRGIGVGAFGTGIAYFDPGIQEKTYPSLEAMKNDAGKVEGFVGYCRISGNWHSFFWEAD
jgi:hypothetical protein